MPGDKNDTFKAASGTLNEGDELDGGGGTDTLKLYSNADVAALVDADIKSIENVVIKGLKGIDGTADVTLDFAGVKGLEKIVIDGYTDGSGTGDHTFSNLGNGVTVALTGSITGLGDADEALTLGFTGTKGNIVLDAFTGDSKGSFIHIGDSLKELTVSGTSAMKGGLTQAELVFNGGSGSNLENLVVNADKDGFIKLDVNSAFAKLAAIDASGSQGQTRFDITDVTSSKVAVTGGAGDDTLRLKIAQVEAGVTFDGGGKHDRAVVDMKDGAGNKADPSDNQYALINKLGAEEIVFENESSTVDAGKLDAHFIGIEDAVTVKNIAADDFIVHSREDGGGIPSGGLTLQTATGNDTIHLIVEKSLMLTADDEGTIINGTSTFKTLNITGNGDQALTYDGNAAIKDLTITGKDFAGKMTLTTGNGDDHITVGSGGSVITGGAGNDTLTLGAGVDTIVISQDKTGALNNVIAKNGTDTVINFQTGDGGDKIDVGNFLKMNGSGATHFNDELAATATGTPAADNAVYLVTYDGTVGTTTKSLYTLTTADVVSEFFGANKLFNANQTASSTEFGLMIKDDAGKAIFVMIDVHETNALVQATDMAITLQIDTIGTGFTGYNFDCASS